MVLILVIRHLMSDVLSHARLDFAEAPGVPVETAQQGRLENRYHG